MLKISVAPCNHRFRLIFLVLCFNNLRKCLYQFELVIILKSYPPPIWQQHGKNQRKAKVLKKTPRFDLMKFY